MTAPHIAEVRRATAALAGAGVPVALLRDGEPEGRFAEIDLLAPPGSRRRVARALRAAGYRGLHAWGHGSHAFHLTYVEDAGVWVMLDVVTRLPGADAGAVLARARPGGAPPRLEGGVETGLLLLHCLVDRGGEPGRHGARLLDAAGRPPAPPPGSPPALRAAWPRLWAAVRSGELAGSGAGPAAALGAPWWRATTEAALRKAYFLRRALRPMAPTILVLGTSPAAAGDRVAQQLGVPCVRLSLPAHAGPAALRAGLEVALRRRRTASPLVVDAPLHARPIMRADVVVRVGDRPGADASAPGAPSLDAAVWRAYRRRLPGRRRREAAA